MLGKLKRPKLSHTRELGARQILTIPYSEIMRLTLILILFSSSNWLGQTRTITGRVVDENLSPISQARIDNSDTILPGRTDNDGKFKIDVPVETQSLIILWVGMEWKFINLPGNCDHLEVILLHSGSYDFMSARKVDRLRMKQFKKLPKLHQAAFQKGIFIMEKPCYKEEFIPEKKQLKEIRKSRIEMSSTLLNL
jgi:hypothetical protein